MKKYNRVQTFTKELASITCDKCKKEYDADNWQEIQEFLHIDFEGGYGSVFGDGKHIAADICQHCLKEMIGDFCREVHMLF